MSEHIDFVAEPPPIVLQPRVAVCWGDLPRVVAVVAKNLSSEIANLPVFQVHPLGDIGINVPAEQHVFVKP